MLMTMVAAKVKSIRHKVLLQAVVVKELLGPLVSRPMVSRNHQGQ